MACCLSPSCCPTRRPTGSRAKRIRPITAAQPPVVPSGELQCIKIVPPLPSPVEDIVQPLKPSELTLDIVPATERDINTNVTSLTATGEVNDFMAAFFRNCEQIARDNQEALHRALLLDDNDRANSEQQPVGNRGDSSLSLTSTLSSSSSVRQHMQPQLQQALIVPSTVAESCRTSCRYRLQYQDAIEDVITSSVGTASCCSSTVGGVSREVMAAFIAPTNSPVSSSSPVTPTSGRIIHSTTAETPRSVTAPSDSHVSTSGRNSPSSRTVSCKRRYRHLPNNTSSKSRRILGLAAVATPARYLPGLGSRPPCLGQECSPIRTTPCGAGTAGFESTPADDLRRFYCHHYLGHGTAMTDSCVTMTAIDPPAPVVQRSCQKVDRWLRRLEHCSDDDDDDDVIDDVITLTYHPDIVKPSPALNIDNGQQHRAHNVECQMRFHGSKRKMCNIEIQPMSCTPPTSSRREVIGSGSPRSSVRQNKCRRRRYHFPGIGDNSLRRKSLAAYNSRRTLSDGRKHHVSASLRGGKALLPSVASSSAANSSGWLADRSSSTVVPSTECNSKNPCHRRHPTDVGLGDFRTVSRRRVSDSHEVYRRRQVVARRMRRCVRDVHGYPGNGVCVETLAVL